MSSVSQVSDRQLLKSYALKWIIIGLGDHSFLVDNGYSSEKQRHAYVIILRLALGKVIKLVLIIVLALSQQSLSFSLSLADRLLINLRIN